MDTRIYIMRRYATSCGMSILFSFILLVLTIFTCVLLAKKSIASGDSSDMGIHFYIYWEVCESLVSDFPQGEELRIKLYGRESDQVMAPFLPVFTDKSIVEYFGFLIELDHIEPNKGYIYEIRVKNDHIYANNQSIISDKFLNYLGASCSVP